MKGFTFENFHIKRFTAMLLCLFMVIGCMPFCVLAASETTTKTVYKLVDTVSPTKNYLIVNSNSAGVAQALCYDNGSVGTETVTITAGDSMLYIETVSENAVHKYTNQETLQSVSANLNNTYLRGNSRDGTIYYDRSEAEWSYTDGCYLTYGSRTTRYLVYNDGWCISTIAENVYLYEETEITVTDSGDTTVDDYPVYPNEGAIRYNKTALGKEWAETAVAEVELSMTGVPYSTNNEIDVVIMLDMSGSMDDGDRLKATQDATITLIDELVKDEYGNFTNNKIAVYYFRGHDNEECAPVSSKIVGLQRITKDNYTTLINAIKALVPDDGTPYNLAMKKVYDLLETSEKPESKQYCVFLSDGAASKLEVIAEAGDSQQGHYTKNDAGYSSSRTVSGMFSFTGSGDNASTTKSQYYRSEYYSTELKTAGVTMYTVGLLINQKNSNWSSSLTSKQCHIAAQYILGEMSSGSDYFYECTDAKTVTDDMKAVFKNIGTAIREAATETVVTDQISTYYDLYTHGNNHSQKNTDANDDVVLNPEDVPITITEYQLDDQRERIYDTSNPLTAPKEVVKVIYNTTTSEYDVYYEGIKGTSQGVVNNLLTIPKKDGTGNWFVYDTVNKSFTWNIGTVHPVEYALSYHVILKTEKYNSTQSYPTNTEAKINYINHRGNPCEVLYPVPELPWRGAQVSYMFYLVNNEGNPVNLHGIEVPFKEAHHVTDPVHYEHYWDVDGEHMEASQLARTLLPRVYSLYDESVGYTIDVKKDGSDNYFQVTSTSTVPPAKYTTYVFNTFAKTHLIEDYAIHYENDYPDLNFENTTVAFAVVWNANLVSDSVVIDYGQPVSVDVTKNDLVNSGIEGLLSTAPSGVAENSGHITESLTTLDEVTTDYGVFTIDGTKIKYTPRSMKMNTTDVVYYVSTVNYIDSNNQEVNVKLYSSLTVIPATAIYYEAEDFVTSEGWESVTSLRSDADKAQDADRPGLLAGYDDSNNNYGYDSHYTEYLEFSADAAKKVTVSSVAPATAEFTFTGTGFDIISLTSGQTGTIVVQIDEGTDTAENLLVDTYYGYTYDAETDTWTASQAADTLYQVPVIKWSGAYGTHTVKITASYAELFDHGQYGEEKYDFYLDAIRIYDPTGVVDQYNYSSPVYEAYFVDGEANPQFIELRDKLIAEGEFIDGESTVAEGAVFIDGKGSIASVADYENYGPNNEVYLTNGQSVAFKVGEITQLSGQRKVQLAMKSANAKPVTVRISNPGGESIERTIATASDLYYDITRFASNVDKVVIVTNVSDSILSITNIKVTNNMKEATTALVSLYMDTAGVESVLYCLNNPLVFAPEHFDLHITAGNLKVGQKVKAVATTSADVAYVVMNGETVTKYRINPKTGLRTWTLQLTAEKAGEMTVTAFAYNEDGVASAIAEDSIIVSAKHNNQPQGGKKH